MLKIPVAAEMVTIRVTRNVFEFEKIAHNASWRIFFDFREKEFFKATGDIAQAPESPGNSGMRLSCLGMYTPVLFSSTAAAFTDASCPSLRTQACEN